MNNTEVHVVNDIDEFLAIQNEWASLLSISSNATPFHSHHWLLAWWEVFGKNCFSLQIVLLRKGGRLVAAIPLYKRKLRFLGISYTEVRFIGTGGGHDDEICTEYMDVLYDPDEEPLVLDALADYLSTNPLGTDIYHFGFLLEKSLVGRLFDSGELSRETRSAKQTSGFRYYIELPNTWEAFEAGLSSYTRKHFRQGTRRAERMGELHFFAVDDEKSMDEYFQVLCELHTNRWAYKGQAGVFGNSQFLAFHRLVIKRFLQENWLNFYVYTIEKVPVAILYNFVLGDTEYYYQSGMNVVDYGRTHPGTVLLCNSIGRAIHQGLQIYDLMQGGDESYKSGYGCTKEEMYNHLYFCPTWKAVLLYGLYRITKRTGYLIYNERLVEK